MAPKQATMEELVSHMFIMGRLMRDKMNKNLAAGAMHALLRVRDAQICKRCGPAAHAGRGKELSCDAARGNALIDGLVKAKLLARVLDPKDRRSVRVIAYAERKAAARAGDDEESE